MTSRPPNAVHDALCHIGLLPPTSRLVPRSFACCPRALVPRRAYEVRHARFRFTWRLICGDSSHEVSRDAGTVMDDDGTEGTQDIVSPGLRTLLYWYVLQYQLHPAMRRLVPTDQHVHRRSASRRSIQSGEWTSKVGATSSLGVLVSPVSHYVLRSQSSSPSAYGLPAVGMATPKNSS